MNDVSKILDKIALEAREYESELLAQSQREAQTILSEYKAEAEIESAAILAEAKARLSVIDEQAKSRGEANRRKLRLAMKGKAIDQAFGRSLQKLCALPEEEQILLMVRMALKYQTKDALLIFNRKDQDAVGPAVVESLNYLYTKQAVRQKFSGSLLEKLGKLFSSSPQKLTVGLSPKAGGFAGGFIIQEGDIETNCTFEVLVSSQRENLEGEISSTLFD